MKTRKTIPCIICEKPVKQETSTSVERQTCHRKKVNGVMEPSECEREKSRRYQKQYRHDNPPGKTSKKIIHDRSIALCSLKHLAKHKAMKYNRKCLKCREKFTGIGKYNRICNTCTIENSRQSSLKGAWRNGGKQSDQKSVQSSC